MNVLDQIPKIKLLYDYLKSISEYQRSLHGAYWIAPLIICGYWYTLVTNEFIAGQNEITVVPLFASVDSNGDATSKPGLIILSNQFNKPFQIPFDDTIPLKSAWSSLDVEEAKANYNKINFSKHNGIEIDPVFYGGRTVFGLVLEGIPDGVLNTTTGSNSISEFFPGKSASIDVAFGILISVAFGFGLLFSSFTLRYLEFAKY